MNATGLDVPEKRSGSSSSPADAPHYSAERVRGGEVILRTRAERLIFVAGLVGVVLLAAALALVE